MCLSFAQAMELKDRHSQEDTLHINRVLNKRLIRIERELESQRNMNKKYEDLFGSIFEKIDSLGGNAENVNQRIDKVKEEINSIEETVKIHKMSLSRVSQNNTRVAQISEVANGSGLRVPRVLQERGSISGAAGETRQIT